MCMIPWGSYLRVCYRYANQMDIILSVYVIINSKNDVHSIKKGIMNKSTISNIISQSFIDFLAIHCFLVRDVR